MNLLAPYALFIFVNLLGAMSPGPDFAIVTRYGLTGCRRSAISAAAGISCALFVHVSYCLLGIAILIYNSKWLFSLLQIGGASYLTYLGIGILRTNEDTSQKKIKNKLRHSPFTEGLLTNLLNPKASLFLLSLFTQFIEPTTPLWSKITYGLLVPATAFGWFSFLAAMLTHKRFLPHLQKYQQFFTKAMGVLLLALAFIVVVSVVVKIL